MNEIVVSMQLKVDKLLNNTETKVYNSTWIKTLLKRYTHNIILTWFYLNINAQSRRLTCKIITKQIICIFKQWRKNKTWTIVHFNCQTVALKKNENSHLKGNYIFFQFMFKKIISLGTVHHIEILTNF